MGDSSLTALTPGYPVDPNAQDAVSLPPRLELPEVSDELLAIVRYLTAPDGPLTQLPETGGVSPWHERLLRKAAERLALIDTYLRGRFAFFVAAEDGGFGTFEREAELAGAALDNCRAVSIVVESLLAGDLPTAAEYDAMGDTALRIFPARDRF